MIRYGSRLLSRSRSIEKEKSQLWNKGINWKELKLEDVVRYVEEVHEPPSVEIFTSVLFKCKQEKSLCHALRLHKYMQQHGLDTHETLGNFLVPLLVEVGSMCDAQLVFNRLVSRNEHSWNSLITGFVKCGDSHNAFTVYEKMQKDSIQPSGFTYVALLKACANLKDVERGQELHDDISRSRLGEDLFVGSSLVDMYVKCGYLGKAQEVFDKLGERDAISWNALIVGYCKHRLYQKALNLYDRMQVEGVVSSCVTFFCILKACGGLRAIYKGQQLHTEIAKKGLLDEGSDITHALIGMYADSGFFLEAEAIVEKLSSRDTTSWTVLIAGYCEHKLFHEMLSCFEQMQCEGVAPSVVTFVCSLKCCGTFGFTCKGQEIHAEVVKKGWLENNLINTALVDMYANCGLVAEAHQVFDSLLVRDVVSWTALLTGYAKHGHVEEAVNCFTQMKQENISPDTLSWNALIEGFAKHGHGEEALYCFLQMNSQGVPPDSVTFIFSLKACGISGATSLGQELHVEIARNGLLERASAVGNALLDFYASSGLLAEAQHVFNKLPVPDVVSWTSLMAGYIKHGSAQEALNLFDLMHLLSFTPSVVTYVCGLKACGDTGATEKGQELHSDVEKKGFLESNVVGNAVVDMYACCGLFAEALEVFKKLPVQDAVSWTSLITGYAKHGHVEEAKKWFDEMQSKGVFPDAVTWSALISGYAKHKGGEEALNRLEEMKLAGVSPDAVTFASSLKACGSVRAIDKGREIHAEIAMKGLLERDIVVGNALIDMYGTCGVLIEAQNVFDKLVVCDEISWTSLIAGYTKHGYGEEALNCFEQMLHEGFSADVITFVCSLKACGSTGATDKGQELHEEIVRNGLLEKDLVVGNALLDMYTDCGLLTKAQEVFDKLPVQDAISWSALIAGYAKHGRSEEALSCFERMQLKGVTLDTSSSNTLISGYACIGESTNYFHVLHEMSGEGMSLSVDMHTIVFTACSHAGLVDLGQSYFEAMSEDSGCTPTVEHYFCMVDLLGRAGQLEKAVAMIKQMPYHPDLVVWHTMLGACRKWGNLELGSWAFKHAVHLDARDCGAYVCVSNIYVDTGMQEEAKKVDVMRVTKQTWQDAATETQLCITQ